MRFNPICRAAAHAGGLVVAVFLTFGGVLAAAPSVTDAVSKTEAEAADDKASAVQPTQKTEPAKSAAPAKQDAKAGKSAPRKSFVERRPLVSSDAYRGLAEQMAGGSVLADVVQRLNKRIELPEPVALRFAECGEVNAYFLPDQREVRLCFELFDQIAELLAQQVEDEAQLTQALSGVLSFVALHEVGHAVVAVRAVPMIGNEETAVDQFAVWLLIDGKEGDLAVLSAAAAFAAGMTLGGDDPSGAHATDAQRYFNLVCWLAGSNPDRKAQVISDWALPIERAQGCEQEYQQLSQGWRRLLASPMAPTKAPPAKPSAAQPAASMPQRSESESTESESPERESSKADRSKSDGSSTPEKARND